MPIPPLPTAMPEWCPTRGGLPSSREPLAMELEELVRPITRHIADNGVCEAVVLAHVYCAALMVVSRELVMSN